MYKRLQNSLLHFVLSFGGEHVSWNFWKEFGLILSFHGVVPDHKIYLQYPYKNFVPVSTFHDQMSFLAKNCSPIPLRDMFKLIKEKKRLPARAVAITFDDGYKNNIDFALPVLKEFNIPATFFITSGFIGDDRLLPAEEIKLFLFFFSETREIFLQHLKNEEIVTPDPKHLESWIHKAVNIYKRLPFPKANAILSSMRSIINLESTNSKTEPFKFMSSSDLAGMASTSGVDIGAHTVNHVILSKVSENEARHEIMTSKNQLEHWTGKEVDLFAYPNGLNGDFTLRDQKLLHRAGFRLACTEIPGYVKHDFEPYTLPRMDIGQGHTLTSFRAYVCGFVPRLRGWL